MECLCDHYLTNKAYFSAITVKAFMRILPTRWRRKPAGIEITSLSRYAYNVSPPVLREEQARRAYVLLLFKKNFLNTFSDFVRPIISTST